MKPAALKLARKPAARKGTTASEAAAKPKMPVQDAVFWAILNWKISV
jgi:hypothetical protein